MDWVIFFMVALALIGAVVIFILIVHFEKQINEIIDWVNGDKK